MSARWYKRCGADFIHGTMSLTLEEKGAYSLCLDLIYDRCGPIPDDARWLSGVCGVSMRKWKALRERLIDTGKIYVEQGKLSNARADFEIAGAQVQSRIQAESGVKGGRKRAENAYQSRTNNALAQAILKPIEEIREDKREKPNGFSVEADFEAVFDPEALDADGTPTFARQCAAASGISIVSPAAVAAAIDLTRTWLAAGAQPDEVITAIKQRVANATEPIHSLRYFDAAIRQVVARRVNGVSPTPRRPTGKRSAWIKYDD